MALAVTAVVLSALSGALRSAAVTRERTADCAERAEAVRAALLGIASEVEAAIGSFEPGAVERFVVVAPEREGASSELRFAMLDGTLLAYRVDAGSSGGRLVRGAASRFAPPPGPDPVALLSGVRRFRVRCFDGLAWRAGWTRPGLPRAVELALAVANAAGGVDEMATTVVIPASES